MRPVDQANQKSKNKTKTKTTIKNGKTRIIPTYRNGCKNSKRIFVNDRVPERRDTHSRSSHELSLEPTRSVDLGKHSVETHFPKDRNCEICLRTKITRAPCRRRIGRVVPRAENFGDLITADHKVLGEGRESRNSHRCAVVVQDLATQLDPIVSVQNKNFSRNGEEPDEVRGADKES